MSASAHSGMCGRWVGHNLNVSEDMRRQASTADYLDEVLEIARASPMHTGSRIDHANRELVVMGVGEPTEALANVMMRAPQGVRVTWQEAPFTSEQLSAELRRLMSEQGARLTSGWPLTGGTGIGFTATDRSLLDSQDPRSALGSNYPV